MNCLFAGAGAVARKYACDIAGSPLDLVAVCNAIEAAADAGRPVEVSAHGVAYDLPTVPPVESLVDRGLTRTLGICNVSVNGLASIVETAQIRPGVVQVGIDPSTPRTRLVRYCHERGRVLAHSPLSGVDLETNATLRDIAADHDASPAAVVVAWNVTHGVVPIPASVDADHLVENIAAARIRLSASEQRRITTLGE